MLRRVVEDYLDSIKEVQFFLPFSSLLLLKDYFDVHIIHGPTEFGKDIIAKKVEGEEVLQFIFQLKAGDVNLNKFTTEIKPQLLESVTNHLSHPNFDSDLRKKIFLVATGVIKPPATLAFQAFNVYLQTKLHSEPVYTIEKHDIVEDFVRNGIDPFFALHNDPTFVGDFFDLYAKIKNNKTLDSYLVESYTRRWLKVDFNNNINRLQVYFESYLFSALLYKDKRYYESVLFISALVRCLAKNDKYTNYQEIINGFVGDVVANLVEDVNAIYGQKLNLATPAATSGFLGIFRYPKYCLHTLEILSLYNLTSAQEKSNVICLINEIFDKEKGYERPLSDNYAISVAIIGLSLLKRSETHLLKKMINNVTVWLCDRYSNVGLAPLGASEMDEYEQLLSEHLDGLEWVKSKSSYLATVLLDMSYLLGDSDFYAAIANELRATSIILERFHVLYDANIYEYEGINNSYDSSYSKILTDRYSDGIAFESDNITISVRSNLIFHIMFLLRDRMFTTFVGELIQ